LGIKAFDDKGGAAEEDYEVEQWREYMVPSMPAKQTLDEPKNSSTVLSKWMKTRGSP